MFAHLEEKMFDNIIRRTIEIFLGVAALGKEVYDCCYESKGGKTVTDSKESITKKIAELYSLLDEETQSIAIEHFKQWWHGTEELAEMGLRCLKKSDFGDRQAKLKEVTQKLLDVRECGTSSLLLVYFLEFSAEWLEALEEVGNQ